MLARCVEVFGLPGDRYITFVCERYMDFIFKNDSDRLLFIAAWPAHVPQQTEYQLPET